MLLRELLAVVDAEHFFAGVVLWETPDGVFEVVEAAPILSYMKQQRWTRERVRDYVTKKGWTVSVVHIIERERPTWWKPKQRRSAR